jgi:ABC-type antimicrobial peptide transport system permease subunit
VFVPGWGNSGTAFYVSGNLQASALYGAIRGAVKRLDPAMPIYELKTLGRQLDETLLTERLIALLSAGFGLLATLLATIGLYGVMAFVVARRTKELGLRMALGAARLNVVWLVMRDVLTLVAIGLAIGIPAAIGLGQLVASQLYGIQARDPWIAAGSVALLAAVGAVAGMIPATRASRIDPILAIRYE